MKKISILMGTLLLSCVSFSQNFELLSNDDNAILIGHSLSSNATENVIINGQSYIDYAQTNKITMKDAGSPQLPMFSESVIIPNNGAVSIQIEHDGYIEYTNIFVAPSKGSLKRNVNPSDVPYAFGDAYNQDQFFPGNLAVSHDPFILRKTRGTTVTFYPYQYNPVTKVLRVYQNIRATVVTNPEIIGINELEAGYIPHGEFDEIYKNTYLNATTIQTRYTALNETGEMLIIGPSSYSTQIQPLVDWKNQKGIKATFATTTQTGSTAATIKTYIQNYYTANPNLMYVLLVGDHAEVPCYSYGTSSGGEQLWSDSYYAQLTGGSTDYRPEVFIGRLSGTTANVTTMVTRILEYEKTPAAGDWMNKAIGLASAEGSGYGDDGEADWQHARNIRTKLMGYGYGTVHEYYDGSQGGSDASGDPSATTIQSSLSSGIGLLNYTGHGDQTTMVSGNFTTTNITNATNTNKYPWVISVACNNGTFTSGTCISEAWLRAASGSTPKGAISACGSSILMAWAEPMQTQDEIAEIVSESYANNKKRTIGGIFYNGQLSMLEQYNSANGREVIQTWIMFGDPSTLFRNKVTQTLTASHASSVAQSETSVTVTCTVEGALICITQNNVILGTGIVSGGQAVITLSTIPTTTNLLVTGTAQNYSVYQGNISIGAGAPTSVAIALNDADNTFCAGTSVTFTATPTSGGSSPTYQWQVNGVNVGTNASTYTTNALTNGQVVTCIMSVGGTPTNSNSVTVTVNPTPSTPTISATSSVCSGNSVNFTASTITGTYTWSGPNSFSSSQQNPTISSASTSNTGTYYVTVTNNGCTSTAASTSVTVTQTVTPAATTSITNGSNPTCVGQNVTFSAQAANGGTTPSYTWSVNGSTVGTGSTYSSSSLTNNAVVTCILTSNAACTTSSTASASPITMTVNAIPSTPAITASAGGTTLTSSSATGNQWYLDGSIINGATSQIYVAIENGDYTVVVTNGGCSSSASAATAVATVGINELSDNGTSFIVYPNPNNGLFTIQFNSTEMTTYTVEIQNVIGQIIYKENMNEFSGSYTKEFNISNYGKGEYFIVVSDSKNNKTEKLIVY